MKNIKVARDKLPGFRKQAKFYSLEELKKQIQMEVSQNEWPELITGIDQWKQKYLYPFGAIAPLPDE